MGVRDHETDPSQATVVEVGQELTPERLVLGVADIDTEDFTMPIGAETGSDHDCFGHDLTVLPDVDVGGVEPDVDERLMIQPRVRSTVTSASIWVQILDTVDFETPESQPNALTRSSTFRVEVPVM